MQNLPLLGERDDFLATGDRGRNAGPFVSQAGKEGREAVEVVLPPFLERVMVALGTIQADAEEQLADQRRDLLRLATVAEHHGGPVLPGASLGGDQLAGELVQRFVLAE